METATIYKNSKLSNKTTLDCFNYVTEEKPLPQFFDITGAPGIEKLDKEEKEVCVHASYTCMVVLNIFYIFYNLVVFCHSTDARNVSVKQVAPFIRMH